MLRKRKHSLYAIAVMTLVMLISCKTSAQSSGNYMRIAKIVVDSAQLENYKLALKQQMQTALKLEQGVLSYTAVQDKNNPAHITILETYASQEAYQKHTQAPHFKKYKTTVQNMVTSLELTEVMPLATGDKKKMIMY